VTIVEFFSFYRVEIAQEIGLCMSCLRGKLQACSSVGPHPKSPQQGHGTTQLTFNQIFPAKEKNKKQSFVRKRFGKRNIKMVGIINMTTSCYLSLAKMFPNTVFILFYSSLVN
jgi:hypothetical protein